LRILLLVLPLALSLSCYTRLNHPQILAESRLFRPDSASDCLSCHAGESWLETGAPDSYSHRGSDRWASFQGQAAWTRGSAGGASSEPAAPALVAPPLPAPLVVMGEGHATPRLSQAQADSSATSRAPRGKDDGKPRETRPRKTRPAQPVTPSPPKPDSDTR